MLRDHVVWGVPILPGVAFIDAMLGAFLVHSGAHLGDICIQVQDAAIMQPMVLQEGPETWGTTVFRCPTESSGVRLTLKLDDSGDRTYIALSSSHVGGIGADAALLSPATHAEGWVSLTNAGSKQQFSINVEEYMGRMIQNMHVRYGAFEAYQELRHRGLEYGPRFQTIQDIVIADSSALVKLQFQHEVADFEKRFILHPSIFDGCVQAGVLLAFRHIPSCATALVPVAALDVKVWNTACASGSHYWAVVNLIGEPQPAADSEVAIVSITLLDAFANVLAHVGTMRLQSVLEAQVFPQDRDLGRGMLWSMKWAEIQVVPTSQKTAKIRRSERWLVYRGEHGPADSAPQMVESAENNLQVELHYCSAITFDESSIGALEECDTVVHAGGLWHKWNNAVDYLADVLSFLQAITKCLSSNADAASPRIVVAVKGISAVLQDEQVSNPLLAGVRGLCRTAQLEMEAILNRAVPLLLIDIDSLDMEESSTLSASVVLRFASILSLSLSAESRNSGFAAGRRYAEVDLALRGNRTFAPRLFSSEVQLLPTVRNGSLDKSAKTFLITGGLGGLGLVVAQWLAEHGAQTIILLSRTGQPPQKGNTAKLWQQLIEKRYCTQFVVQKCDVACAADVEELFIRLKHGNLTCHFTGMLCFIGQASS